MPWKSLFCDLGSYGCRTGKSRLYSHFLFSLFGSSPLASQSLYRVRLGLLTLECSWVDRNFMGSAGDMCRHVMGMLLVGMEEGLWPFRGMRNVAALAQELASKNGRAGLSSPACVWRFLGRGWQGVRPLSSSVSFSQHCLSEIEVLAIIFAAAIHDYEHTGTTNSFHIQTK